MVGWGSPTIDPNAENIYSNGTICYLYLPKGNLLYGLAGSNKASGLPVGLQVGGTLTLRFHPGNGTIHAAVDAGAQVQIISGITQRDLVPIVMFFNQNDQVSVVD